MNDSRRSPGWKQLGDFLFAKRAPGGALGESLVGIVTIIIAFVIAVFVTTTITSAIAIG